MPTLPIRHRRPRRYLNIAKAAVQVCILATGFWFSNAAWSDETPPPQSPSSESSFSSNANIARTAFTTRLHNLTNRASELAVQALSLLGINYRYGGNSPETGLDCSGLVQYVFKEAWGADLPRTVEQLSQVGTKVTTHDLQPGDLVFYHTLRRRFSHVGIYLGDQKFIHAPSRGSQVRIENMDISYWKKRFIGARRITTEDQQQLLH